MELTDASYILVLGTTIVLVLLMRPTLERVGRPPLVGYVLLGFALRLADARWDLLDHVGHQIFEFLAYMGLLGMSLVPRAEITLIIMERGLDLGDYAVSSELFANMVLVSTATTLPVPVLVRPLLQ